MNRSQIEKILKINGVPENAPDEQIKSVLLSARYNKDELEAAIMVLRQNEVTDESRVDGLHKVFRTTSSLQPHEISQLLSVDVDISEKLSAREKRNQLSAGHEVAIVVLAVLLAVGAVLSYMYINKFGVFHQTASLYSII